MRVLVVGGSGWFGRSLVAVLSARGDNVVVVTRDSARREVLGVVPRLKLVEGDAGKGGAWTSLVADSDAVVLLSSPPLFDQPWDDVEDHIAAVKTRAASDASDAVLAAEKPPRVLILASSTAVYGTRKDVVDERAALVDGPYITAFRRMEAAAQPAAGKTRVVAMRFGALLGPGAPLLARLKSTADLPPPSNAGFSWVHVQDALSTMMLAIDRPVRGAFNVTSPEPTDVAAFVAAMTPRLKDARGIAARLFGKKSTGAPTTLLEGARARPSGALALGYQFKHAKLDAALRAIDQAATAR